VKAFAPGGGEMSAEGWGCELCGHFSHINYIFFSLCFVSFSTSLRMTTLQVYPPPPPNPLLLLSLCANEHRHGMGMWDYKFWQEEMEAEKMKQRENGVLGWFWRKGKVCRVVAVLVIPLQIFTFSFVFWWVNSPMSEHKWRGNAHCQGYSELESNWISL
jgi:hypothetical protein